jgi:hypothetical protein
MGPELEIDDEMDGLDSPTDFDEYEMNPDDCAPDPVDVFDIEYDH